MVSVRFGVEVIKAEANANSETESSWERGEGERPIELMGFLFGVRKCSGIKSL